MARTLGRIALLSIVGASSIVAGSARAATVPTNGLLLGLAADQNLVVTPVTNVVSTWGDENAGNPNRVSAVINSPSLITNFTTPNGSHSAVAFHNGGTLPTADGITLNGGNAAVGSIPALNSVQTISTFVVASLTADQVSRIFITDFGNGSAGWASGITDVMANPSDTKWYNGHGGAALEGDTNLKMTAGTAYLVATSTTASGSTASLSDGTSTVSATSANNSINYNGGGQVAGLGYLTTASPGVQNLYGNIAEVLVYNNAAPGYSASAVTDYINQKYGLVPEPSSLALLCFGGLLSLRRCRASWRYS